VNIFDFKGRRAIVTGGALGLGLAIAERLLDGGAAVSLSKAAVIGLTKSMGKDLAKDGVIVNCIAPTTVGTDMVKAFPQKLVDSMEHEGVNLSYRG
jgi:NAD(P)-dependent dehydrogenase (short-subunit alcohol dehydrogenase family)